MIEARELPTHDEVTMVEEFMDKFESAISEQQRYAALEGEICMTPARAWSTHQNTMVSWCEGKRWMQLWVGHP